MRVLQVNTFHEPVGGAEVHLHQLTGALREAGHEVAIFAQDPSRDVDEPALRLVRRAEFDADLLVRDPDVCAALEAFASRFRPDVVHVHNVWTFPAELLRAIGGLGVPVVQTVHDYNALCPNSWCVLPDGTACAGGPGAQCLRNGCEANYPFDARVLAASYTRYRLARRHVDAFFAPSEALAAQLARHDFPRVEALPLWIDPPAEAPPDEARVPGALLYVGRLVPEKGVAHLLDAMPAVLREHPEARLTLLGDGPLNEVLRARAASLGLDGRVVFRGQVAPAEVREHQRRASALVVPSIWCENSPLSCVESLHAGLPIVASDIGGLPSLVADGAAGLLARPRDAADLASKLNQLLDDDALRARLGEGCRAQAARFSREAHVGRVLEVYAELAAAGGRADGPADEDDLCAVLDGLVRQATTLERWALGLQDHARHLEGRGAVGALANLKKRVGRAVRRRLDR